MTKNLSIDDYMVKVRDSAQRRTLEIVVDRDGNLVLFSPPMPTRR